ncbi:ketoacyl-synt-domain-containing protein [Colletotrichum zoysiae]|uniref:Ketoacyl-synt-domain-containing protein n=1 Tax=Colletotrichum zoysiae TaxID=1216348 RepID=A0AAD9HUW2_9PEZI|nr:ketoacyl-synt-domain-containing protein [Colletotrichum zoysiae]
MTSYVLYPESASIFCPAPSLPDHKELRRLRRDCLNHEYMRNVAHGLRDVPGVWDNVKDAQDVSFNLSKQGNKHAQSLIDWISAGETDGLAGQASTMVTLPILLLSGLSQYFRFLELSRKNPSEFLQRISVGGAQGYCGGLLGALTIASARTEDELVVKACSSLRAAFLIGYFISGDEDGPRFTRRTTLIVRLKYEGHNRKDICKLICPQVYAAAINDPRSICFAGSESAIAFLADYAAEHGMPAQHTYPTGSGHDPLNGPHVDKILALMSAHDDPKLPAMEQLQVPVFSNWDGRPLISPADTDVAKDVVSNIVAGQCDWSTVITNLAQTLAERGSSCHSVVIFGRDCVPQQPFQRAGINISRINVMRTIEELDAAAFDYPDDAVAIVGTAFRLPGANNMDELWNMMENRISMCEEARQDRIPLHKSFRVTLDEKFTNGRKFWANHIPDVQYFDHKLFKINPREAEFMDPQQRLLLEVSYEALESSGYLGHRSYRREKNDNVGCFIGATVVEYEENASSRAPTAYTATGTLQAFLCGRLSYYFGWKGPSETIDTACSSSLVAFNRACVALRAGECKMALAGGSNVLGGVNLYLDLAKARLLSPTGQCKPFDATADGYCRSDGVGVVILKLLRDAEACGDRILAVVPAVGTNQGGLSPMITMPDQDAQVELFQRNLKYATLQPSDLTYVECHGTGTQAGDPTEVGSVIEVFGDPERRDPLYIGSIKGNIGHCEPAAGVSGLLKVLAMFRKGRIPPQGSLQTVNPKIPPLDASKVIIPTPVKRWDVARRAAMVNSYGAAGSNASLICCEYARLPSASTWGWWLPSSDSRHAGSGLISLPLIVTAASPDTLVDNCRAIASAARQNCSSPADVAFTLSEGRQRHDFRFLTTIPSDVDQLATVLESVDLEKAQALKVPTSRKHVVLVFAGQSKQVVHLHRGLYEGIPRFREHVNECSKILLDLGYESPLPSLLDESRSPQDTVILQTGTFIVQYSCARCWIDAGLEIAAVVGHSFGQLVALTVSGVLCLRDGLRAVAVRASLMKSAWKGEKGKMLAVHAAEPVIAAVEAEVDGLETACYNSPSSHVLVGTLKEITAAQTLLKLQFPSVKHQTVETTHGFHSRFTEAILPGLQALEESLDYGEPQIHIELCMKEGQTSKPAKGHIAQHTRSPVFFSDAIRRIEKRLGPCLWLEAGTDSPVIPMAKRAVADVSQHSYQPLKTPGAASMSTDLSTAFVNMWSEGVDSTFWPWLRCADDDETASPQLTDLPHYQFSRTSSWVSAIDHASVLKAKAMEDAELIQDFAPNETCRLVTPHAHDLTRYDVATRSQRFQTIVASHLVRGRALCPASLYLECVAMAVKLAQGPETDIWPPKGTDIVFVDVAFENMLGSGLDREVFVRLDPHPDKQQSWAFTFMSTQANGTDSQKARYVKHANGSVAVVTSSDREHVSELLTERIGALKSDVDAETLRKGRIYSLFKTVVDYTSLMQGLKSVVVNRNKFFAAMTNPTPILGPDESSVLHITDACVVDNFVQPLGFAVNTGDMCDPGVAYLFSGCRSFEISSLCSRNSKESPIHWEVVGSFEKVDEKIVRGNIYVLDPNDSRVVAVILGAQFNKIPLKVIESLLERLEPASKNIAGPGTPPPTPNLIPQPVPRERQHRERDIKVLKLTTRALEPVTAEDKNLQSDKTSYSLKALLSAYVQISSDVRSHGMTLGDLGLDSLAAIELADALQNKFSTQISVEDLSKSTFSDLANKYLSRTPHTSVSIDLGDSTVTEELSSSMFLRLREVVAVHCEISPLLIIPFSTLVDLGVDSLAIVEILDNLQEALGVKIDQNLVEQSMTLEELFKYSELVKQSLSPDPTKTPRMDGLGANRVDGSYCDDEQDNPSEKYEVRRGFLQTLEALCGVPQARMSMKATIPELGIDPLAMEELKDVLQRDFSWAHQLAVSLREMTVGEVLDSLESKSSTQINSQGSQQQSLHLEPQGVAHESSFNISSSRQTQVNSTNLRPAALFTVETCVFKEVDGCQIGADVYIPTKGFNGSAPLGMCAGGSGKQ